MNELAPLGFVSALLLGLAYGATACSIACVPLVGPALLGRGGGARESWRTVAAFSLGRVSGYMGMAGASAVLGHWVAGLDMQWATRLLVGGGTMALGVLVILRAGRATPCRARPASAMSEVRLPIPSTWPRGIAKSSHLVIASAAKQSGTLVESAGSGSPRPCGPRDDGVNKRMPKGTRRGLHLLGAYATGLGMAFSPCAPLATILIAAATAGSLSLIHISEPTRPY